MSKKIAALVLLVLGAALVANAQAPECVPGKLSDYQKLGEQGCIIGDSRLWGFHYHQADGLPSAAISLTPGTAPGSDDPGLLFEGRWAGSLHPSSFVSYMIEVQPEARLISGATLEMQYGQITGTGEAKVITEICPIEGASDNCGAAALRLQVALSAGPGRKVSDSGQLRTPLRQLRVIHVLSVTPGKNGAASFNGFMTVFHQKAGQRATARGITALSHDVR